MKKAFLLLLILISFRTNAQFSGPGLGVIIGEPTGISFKQWTGDKTAIDAAAAWSIADNGYFSLHADFLMHNFDIIDVESGKLPLYLGVGGYVVLANEIGLGARVPLGINYLFQDVPLDVFLEVVPVLTLVQTTGFNVDAAIDIRYFFNKK